MAAEPAGDPLAVDARTSELVESFCEALRVERNASAHTVRAYRTDLVDYLRWARRARVEPLGATHRQLRLYLAELDRAQYSRTTVNRRLSALRGFFRWLNVTGVLEEDPAGALSGPRSRQSLPHVIRAADMARLLSVHAERDAAGRVRAQSPADLRNQAILEFLYACGARVSEASGLLASHVDLAAGQAKVLGKGAKERIVPLHDLAVASMRAYASEARPALLRDRTCEFFFVSTRGGRMGTDAIRKMFKDALRKAGLDESHRPARRRGRPAQRAGDARACEPVDHPDLHAPRAGAPQAGARAGPPPRLSARPLPPRLACPQRAGRPFNDGAVPAA